MLVEIRSHLDGAVCMLRLVVLMLAMLLIITPAEATQQLVERYLQTEDARIYYEIYGEGKPVLLLHGGLFGYIDEFEEIISHLRANHMVIAIATRGHGKSELGKRDFSFELFSKDAASVIEKTTSQKVDVIGFSDGAITGYSLAASRPDLVNRLIAVGGPLGFYGYETKGEAELADYDTAAEVEKMAPEFVAKRKKLMPNPDQWPELIQRLVKMWRKNEYISREYDFRKRRLMHFSN